MNERITEALHSCICLLETMAESAKARDDHAEWAMMSAMASNCRDTLETAALQHQASLPVEAEGIPFALIEQVENRIAYRIELGSTARSIAEDVCSMLAGSNP